MDKKRIVFAIIFVAVSALLGYAIYRVFFASEKPATPPTTPTSTPGAFPDSQAGGPDIPGGEVVTPGLPTVPTTPTIDPGGTPSTPSRPVSPVQQELVKRAVSSPINSPSISSGGNVKYYNEQDGKFYTLDARGNVRTLSDETFFNVDSVTWSPAGNDTVIEYPDGSNIYYNFDTKERATLPQHWQDFSFSPQGEKIVAKSIALDPDNRWLVTSDPNGNSIELVEPMGMNAYRVISDWSPTRQVIALSRTGKALGSDRQEVLLVGQHGENFPSIVVEGRDLRTEWSPTGSKLLHSVYSTRSEFKPELWVVNASPGQIGTGRRLLNVNTWADKCTFADDRFVYCGVPKTLQVGAAFAPEVADNTDDTIYRIDTQTGSRIEIDTDDNYTVDSIFVSDDGDTLYFTDKGQPGLFEIDL